MLDEDQIRHKVRRVVYRTLGLPRVSRPVAARSLVTEADVQAVPIGGRLSVPQGALITPLARQVALERHVTLSHTPTLPHPRTPTLSSPGGQQPAVSLRRFAVTPQRNREHSGERSVEPTVAIGADHGGYELKEMLKGYLGELGYGVVDCGTDSTASVDYPDFAFAVARLVAQGRVWRGIIVDGAGIGSCMAANKVTGVRASLCYDQATAANSREHNDANVLTLGAGLIGPNLARQIVKTWLKTPFGGGRHARRVDKIMEIERRFMKNSE